MNLYAKRILLSLGLGVIFALIDIALTNGQNPLAWDLNGPVFWFLFLSRAPIGFFVGLVGVVTAHPIFPIIHMRYLRGIGVGAILSLGLATTAFFSQGDAWTTFLMTIGAGALYGLLVDVLATHLIGDGKSLLSYEQ